MARPKRNALEASLETTTAETVTKKSRRSNVTETAATTRPRRSSGGHGDTAIPTPKKRGRPPKTAVAQVPQVGARRVGRKGKAIKTAAKEADSQKAAAQARRGSDVSVEVPSSKAAQATEEPDDEDEDEEGTSYWLMKAEPESRIEKGRDVKFSIEDLRNAKEPEGWDARNNMRAMRKGDLAFFYHSNTKVPGIAGVMEIVREHSVDDTAFDPGHPYYDPKSVPEKPKWDLVHVEFRQKFASIVRLKDLQKFSKPGGVLSELQTLKQTRLSVTKVMKREWEFIMSLAEVEQDNSHKNGNDANPTTNAAGEIPADVHRNGVLPNRVRQHESTGEEEGTVEVQPAVNDDDSGNSVPAQKAKGKAGRGSRKSKR